MKKLILILVTLLLHKSPFAATLDQVKFGGFVDTYYAYDFNAPADHEREFTTQPARHNEFGVNLAYLDAQLSKEKMRGRLALQMGHSMTKNTTAEPNQDLKYIQEAFAGRKIGENTWVDMGIFLGNIGMESWISKENWTYTRSLMSEYTPYYSAGVRLQHQLNPRESLQVQILNGWQNMTENNQSKALAMQYRRKMRKGLVFTYNNFHGDEEVVSSRSRFRGYHNFILQAPLTSRWQIMGGLDVGHQSQQDNDGVDLWGVGALILRQQLDSENFLSYRLEYYLDPHQANVLTQTPHGFEVVGASLNFDQNFEENALWRTEIRGFYSRDRIYPEGRHSLNRLDGFVVTSVAFWF